MKQHTKKLLSHLKKPKIFLPLLIIIIFVCGFTIVLLKNLHKKDLASGTPSPEPETKITEEKPEKTEPEPVSEPEPEANPESTQKDPIENTSRTYPGGNCTSSLGRLMLINPVFKVGTDFIARRKSELIDITSTYGIIEGVSGNGRPLLDAEAAKHLNQMVQDYVASYPGHRIETRSCFRSYGTNCGRLCYATGTSDHHSGYTCDLIDPAYGTSLDTDHLPKHIEWQWLKKNSYKYGFIDRFPKEWAGGPMSKPVNINAQGSTGLFETWHYRYVGITAATEIATGKYNNGKYDSLEHYLLARGFVNSLTNGTCK